MNDSAEDANTCRLCLFEDTPETPLLHPCLCTGSIKYIHQDCLIRWLNHVHLDSCNICGHRFSFLPLYAIDTPKRLPIIDVLTSMASTLMAKIKYCLHFILVGIVWLVIVPLTGERIRQSLFNCTFDPLVSLPLDIWLSDNIFNDICNGVSTVIITFVFFAGVILIRNHILMDWVDRNVPNEQRLINRLMLRNDDEENNEEIEEIENDGEDEEDEDLFELPVEQLVGYDETLVFLRHVILLIFMNAYTTFMFVFFPYHIGKLAIAAMALQDNVVTLHFKELVPTIFGYYFVTIFLSILSSIANYIGLRFFKKIFWHSLIFIKVFTFLVILIGVVPVLSACWMDICSFSMFDISLKERIQHFDLYPYNFVFMHWISGLMYLYCFLPVLNVFQEVARPGIIWSDEIILINYSEFFSFIQDLIELRLFYHSQKLIVSIIIYGTVTFILVWMPIRILKFILPSFLPYTAPTEGNYFSEWSIFITFLMVPIMEQSILRYWMKRGIEIWCINVSRILGLKSYLLGDKPPTVPRKSHVVQVFQPYTQPTHFVLRLVALLILVNLTLIVIGLFVIIIPMSCIRLVMPFFPALLPTTKTPYRPMIIHDIIISTIHLYFWKIVLGVRYLLWRRLLLEGPTIVMNHLKFYFKKGFKAIVTLTVLFCIIPQLFGILFQLILVVPFNVPMHQSPVLWEMKNIGLNIFCIKLLTIVFILGPDCTLRRSIKRVYMNGFANFNFELVIKDIAMPVICVFSLLLTVPYIIAYSLVPYFINSQQLILLIPRVIYPIFLFIVVIIKVMMILVSMFISIHNGILNERYQVGREFLNYDRR